MDRQKLIQNLEATIGAAVGVVLSQQTSHLITKLFHIQGAAITFAIIIVTASIIITKFLIGSLFVRSKTLRRILLGKQYVEGTWFDIMRINNKVAEIGFSRISYTHKDIQFWGEDYELEMDQCFPYRADMVQMNWPTLHYVYTANRSDTEEKGSKGYGELDFQKELRGCPKKYSGKYFILRGTDKVSFEGVRINERKHKTLIRLLEEPATRKKALHQLLEIYVT